MGVKLFNSTLKDKKRTATLFFVCAHDANVQRKEQRDFIALVQTSWKSKKDWNVVLLSKNRQIK